MPGTTKRVVGVRKVDVVFISPKDIVEYFPYIGVGLANISTGDCPTACLKDKPEKAVLDANET